LRSLLRGALPFPSLGGTKFLLLLTANVFAQHSDCTCILQQCTAQGGEVWHLLAAVNFRCLGPRERSERGPRRRKLTAAKRCRVSRRHSSAVHGTRRRGLAPLGRCQLPLPRASRAKRAGPEAAEVDSGQAMSGIPQQCTAQGGEVWHLLAVVNFRCLGPRERSERGPRRRKLTAAKRCRVSRR
ncbi:hypothetical protein TYRP_000837, partial [Tyrophagus putrescentiae]